MAPTGVEVHMRLNRVMTSMLITLDPPYKRYQEPYGSVVVKLDKALYGCVEASLLWYNDLMSKLREDGFIENPYDRCVFNKIGKRSERLRHINILHFWLSEKVAQKEVTLKHLSTEDMFANILIKPVQGAQFEQERLGLTNLKA